MAYGKYGIAGQRLLPDQRRDGSISPSLGRKYLSSDERETERIEARDCPCACQRSEEIGECRVGRSGSGKTLREHVNIRTCAVLRTVRIDSEDRGRDARSDANNMIHAYPNPLASIQDMMMSTGSDVPPTWSASTRSGFGTVIIGVRRNC